MPAPATDGTGLKKRMSNSTDTIHESQLLKDALRVREEHNTGALLRGDGRPLFQEDEVDIGCREYMRGDKPDCAATCKYNAESRVGHDEHLRALQDHVTAELRRLSRKSCEPAC
ncbi:hypothetical protein SUNI508_07608 [Seiridium unicorne]|uniref:DUF222 domain-containing protein n=1 Tax=Seiridium unicorne TaxID=138068 RepID=A0ABR2UWS5_9PEZI